jgi:hypothetical protein
VLGRVDEEAQAAGRDSDEAELAVRRRIGTVMSRNDFDTSGSMKLVDLRSRATLRS